jgi:hypothetical protein
VTSAFTSITLDQNLASWECQLIANWEQRPSLLDGRRMLVEESSIFDYLCHLGAGWDTSNAALPRVYFATERGETPVSAAFFPTISDSSFEAYLSRVSAEHCTQSVLLYVRNAQLGSKSLRDEVERLLAPVWISGLRWERMEVELFVGRYDWTAIGIHRETCANVHHVVRGEKEMYTWPPTALSARSDRPECAMSGSASEAVVAGILEHSDCARIKAASGQAIYVPSGHWHVGVSRQPSVTINLALYGIR